MRSLPSVVLLLIAPLASAAVPKASTTAYTHEYCLTARGTKPVRSVPTTTITVRDGHTYTSTSTVTPTITITPTAKTTTRTRKLTTTNTSTAPQHTDTTTVTSTETDTTTLFSSTVTTSTSTATLTATTTTTATSTVSTNAGFTPIASVSSVQNGGGGSQKPAKKRDTSPNKARSRLSTNKDQCPRTYPQEVTCYKRIDTYSVKTTTVTATTTSTATAPRPPAVHTSTTVTDTVTTTVTPADTTTTASSTATTLSTTVSVSTSTTTTTSTETTTTTSVAALQTVYAACAADNVIDAVGGVYVSEVSASTAFSGTNDNDMNDPTACCNICQATNGCAGWFIANPGGFYGCTTIPDAGSCDPEASPWGFHTSSSFSETFYVGDGPCGQGTYNGPS